MTDRPILTLPNARLSESTRTWARDNAEAERALVKRIERAQRAGKKVSLRIVYPEPKRSVRR